MKDDSPSKTKIMPCHENQSRYLQSHPSQSQGASRQMRRNGHTLTPTQWLERLSSSCGGADNCHKGGGGGGSPGMARMVAEEELRQLTHLLFTDQAFTEQVSKLPHVAQIMAFYQQQHQLQQQQKRCQASTPQSFLQYVSFFMSCHSH